MAMWKQGTGQYALMFALILVLSACARPTPPAASPAPAAAAAPARAAAPATKATTAAEQFATSPNVQAGIAVGEFASFYLLNTRSRPVYCRSMNFDIAPFVAAFSAANAAEWVQAQSLMRRAKVDPEAVWAQSQPTLDAIVQRGLGNSPGMSAPDTCRAMATAPDAAATSLTYRKVNPLLHRALMAAK